MANLLTTHPAVTSPTTSQPAPVVMFTNVVDELINGGLSSEKISSDDVTMLVMVKVPETEVPGIMEILNRHEPTKIS